MPPDGRTYLSDALTQRLPTLRKILDEIDQSLDD